MRGSLWIEGVGGLSARHFSVFEAMSSPFEASVVAVSSEDDLDLETIVGAPASFDLDAGGDVARSWSGVVGAAEQLHAEETGLSTYRVRIFPRLALLAHRSRSRVYQNLSVPEIVQQVLEGAGVGSTLDLDRASYPKHEYRVQHGETDLAFAERLLEEAGIAYHFEPHADDGSRLVLTDRAHRREPRHRLRFVEHPGPESSGAFLTRVSVARHVGPGAHTLLDHDPQKHKDARLVGSKGQAGAESWLSHVTYELGAILRQGENKADDVATLRLEAHRAHLKLARFTSTTIDLAPGTVFSLQDHPRADLAADKPLLCLELHIEGTVQGHLVVDGTAAPASVAHRPAHRTPRPHVAGVESAVVVGPKGETIHTDEHGRVKIQFAWDKEQPKDETSSCWVRACQPWAGAGFGMMLLPRIGQEVMVAFANGDPDQPVVVGRVHNAEATPPYKLPEGATKSGWKTESVPKLPDESAYNEIAFEDRKGQELLSIRAERDYELYVKGDEVERIGGARTISIGQDRLATVGRVDSTLVGERYAVAIASPGAEPTRLEMSDRSIVCTTGQATVTFAGPDISLEADGNVTIVARDGDVIIQGGPHVKING